MTLKVNDEKKKFILQYILNARLNGRTRDIENEHERQMVVNAAGDLYDKTVEMCTSPDDPK